MSRLSWNEIRVNATKFSEEWKDAKYEKGETQSFYNDFFAVFGVNRRKVASFEEPVKKLHNKQGFIDLFWRKTLLVEHKSAGKNLADAKAQAFEYFVGIKDEDLPRYLLLCDFQNFQLFDLEEQTEVHFPLAELGKHVEDFGFILGIQKRTFRDQAPVNIEASEKMGALHDALYASGYRGHDLERLLVRLLFCLFADDTGIFGEKDIFFDLISDCTHEDGSDLGQWLSQLFDTLNEPETERQATLPERLSAFPYINGALFSERLRTPAFNALMRKRLLEACDFNWDAISPAIFGALFQSVMNKEERRGKGAHYTTERNILKVIEPLFLDELRDELKRTAARKDNGRRSALVALQEKLAGLTFLDPACGCGNFLIIAYRELRELELALLRELHPEGQQVMDVAQLSRCDVTQFYGIEIGEFAARIAEVALWMTDHIANNRLSLAFGQVFNRIPLKAAPHIRHADALETDWSDLLPAAECSYVLGNPPFIGVSLQTTFQREQLRRIVNVQGSGTGLDYVAAWFLKAGEYAQKGNAQIGFVSTNSITQGEQVTPLWRLVFDRYGLEISFAHRTFAWGSDARGVAHVHVVIVGLARREAAPKERRLFSYTDIKSDPLETKHTTLSAYLTDASLLADPHLTITDTNKPINGMPAIKSGTKPTDGGYLIFTSEERDEFLTKEPNASIFMRPFIGADEFINGKQRYILALQSATPSELRVMPYVKERLEQVKQMRASSSKSATQNLANTPTRFECGAIPDRPFLVFPLHTSETRDYIPLAYTAPPVIASNATSVLLDAEKWQLALLTSRIHMAWMRYIGGRIKSDYRYSIGIVYNNFPLPVLDEKAKESLSKHAEEILKARAAFPSSTLADLYDPLTMPPALRKAHSTLDAAVDKLYRTAPFSGDRERVEFLLAAYESLTAPLMAFANAPKKRKRVTLDKI
ncbi:class I SAM-dependent DNA methyltransferase [Armatimonas sp.]|uniref:class I SAM-dependent DNA methyltransferase n=1 Tax=Armatimonas sp. TaxID=1872638 RepID=UPI0037539B26